MKIDLPGEKDVSTMFMWKLHPYNWNVRQKNNVLKYKYILKGINQVYNRKLL